jgi:hypothetical protein
MTIEISSQALTQKRGFRSRKPNALTGAERQRKYRRKEGGRTINTALSPDIAASLIYLRKEWGMESDREAVEAAVRFLTLCTRQGLTRIPQGIDD